MNKSKNNVTVVGTIEEVNIEYSKDVAGYFTPNYKGGYTRKDTSNPMLRIRVERKDDPNDASKVTSTATVDVNMFDVPEKIQNKDKKIVENSNFKVLKKIVDMGSDAIGKPIRINGSYAEAQYVSKDGELKRLQQFQGKYMSLDQNIQYNTDGSVKQYADGTLTGVIKDVRDELRGDEETGRKIVEFYYIDKHSDNFRANRLDLILDEDLADEFELEAGDNAQLNVEIRDVTHGATQKQTSSKRRRSDAVSGYVAHEFHIFDWVDDPIEDDDDHYIDEDEFKAALKIRDVEGKAKIQKKKKDSGSGTATRGGLGKRRHTESSDDEFSADDINEEVDDEENPFN